eukprot:7383993-Prymnesium_polylepis.1
MLSAAGMPPINRDGPVNTCVWPGECELPPRSQWSFRHAYCRMRRHDDSHSRSVSCSMHLPARVVLAFVFRSRVSAPWGASGGMFLRLRVPTAADGRDRRMEMLPVRCRGLSTTRHAHCGGAGERERRCRPGAGVRARSCE